MPSKEISHGESAKQALQSGVDILANAVKGTLEDLVAAGVIDPSKVTQTALQKAASIAALLLTTEALVTEESKKSERSSRKNGL